MRLGARPKACYLLDSPAKCEAPGDMAYRAKISYNLSRYLKIGAIMSEKDTILAELEAVKAALARLGGVGSLDDIVCECAKSLSQRTMQRRLHTLQQQGGLTISGQARSTRYHLIEEDSLPFPLSGAAQGILKLVSRPIQQRQPVGYDREFLARYQPNKSRYLSQSESDELMKIAKTNVAPNTIGGTHAQSILNRLLIDLSWNSSRLEGNTYSLLETQRLIELGKNADDKSLFEAQMILNHKDAIEFLVSSVSSEPLNSVFVRNLHALLANNLLPDSAAGGRLRQSSVGIAQSVYEPLAIPAVIVEHFELIFQKATQIIDPIEQAFFFMVHLPYLQPFDDVNKRVSRLMANFPLMQHNLSPLSFIDVPKSLYIQATLAVYESNQTELLKEIFLWAYRRSIARYAALRQSLGEPDPFRFKYRELIESTVAKIVTENISLDDAPAVIKNRIKVAPLKDREKLTEIIDTELLSLHEGNIARYKIPLPVFLAWKIK